MSAREIAVVGFFALLFLGVMGFVRGDYDTRWEARNNTLPQYVMMADLAKHTSFRGTFGD